MVNRLYSSNQELIIRLVDAIRIYLEPANSYVRTIYIAPGDIGIQVKTVAVIRSIPQE